jgi:hypothetical protein
MRAACEPLTRPRHVRDNGGMPIARERPAAGTGFLTFGCPRCLADIEVLSKLAGRDTTCPHCARRVRVPGERVRARRQEETPEAREPGPWVAPSRDEERRQRAAATPPAGLVLYARALYAITALGCLVAAGSMAQGHLVSGFLGLVVCFFLLHVARQLGDGRRAGVVGLVVALALLTGLDVAQAQIISSTQLRYGISTRRVGEYVAVMFVLRSVLLGLPALVGFCCWRRLR